MFYFIYTMLGSLCIFFSCINLLPEKLSLSCRLLLLFWTLLSSQILNQLLGQYFVFITLPVILLILYHRTSSKWLCLSCSIFGYLFAVTFNYLCIWSLQKITGMTLSQILNFQKFFHSNVKIGAYLLQHSNLHYFTPVFVSKISIRNGNIASCSLTYD